ncbi:hypothetical protein M513_03323 [Trichuris suis]|uniref:Reverse transcriptase domain-containing protein n=1 Tax=Trichuris suis TaxID=68888 RepID=A0A085MF88_9BILA|nr:hypothetical protein M513_03323 [Trichuris suis]
MHKPGVPLRPIVSTINSATSELSHYLKQIIKPLSGKEPSFIRNSKLLVNEIKQMSLNPDEILVSYDVKDLFPSIPISHTLARKHCWMDALRQTRWNEKLLGSILQLFDTKNGTRGQPSSAQHVY